MRVSIDGGVNCLHLAALKSFALLEPFPVAVGLSIIFFQQSNSGSQLSFAIAMSSVVTTKFFLGLNSNSSE